MSRYRTPAWVVVMVVAELCFVFCALVVRWDANAHDRQVDDWVEEMTEP